MARGILGEEVGAKRIKVFWFFFSKKNKRFFLKKEAKTFIRLLALPLAMLV